MERIQLGLALPARPPQDLSREVFLTSVQKGLDLISGHFDSIWMVDHLQDNMTSYLESWTALTYMAALAPRLDIGHVVLCQSFRNPALLAKMATTLQYMSAGRFILGIGAGWKEEEYSAYGYPFPPARTRIEELDEALQIIKALWQERQATVQGRHYHVTNASCEPKPDPIPPIMVGGMKPRMLRVIARQADWWSVFWANSETYRLVVQSFEQACAEVGRDATIVRRTWYGGCFCAPTEEGAIAMSMGRKRSEGFFIGTPTQIIEQMNPFIDLGVDYFLLNWGGFPALTTLETLAYEVLPALNR
jgi:alkanesulfonate monooxygenase SsuD/methylene tetrahydromethanopterin reductase-like flavin-dependent oxidoreductase (luciferase family)